MLSDEQMAAVNHGFGDPATYEWVDLPVGPQPIPDWARGIHIDWMEGYSNPPGLSIKATDDLRTWPGKVWRRVGSRFQARSDDGRLEQYGQDGPLALAKVQMFKSADGTLRQYARTGPEWAFTKSLGFIYPGGKVYGTEHGEFVEVEMLATRQEQGFGGQHVHITLEDGTAVVLRGPWHVGSPPGYVEVAYQNVRDRWFDDVRGKRPWYRVTMRGGLYITEDLYARLFARFAPECRLARVTDIYTRLEPVRGDWELPKKWEAEKWRRR